MDKLSLFADCLANNMESASKFRRKQWKTEKNDYALREDIAKFAHSSI